MVECLGVMLGMFRRVHSLIKERLTFPPLLAVSGWKADMFLDIIIPSLYISVEKVWMKVIRTGDGVAA